MNFLVRKRPTVEGKSIFLALSATGKWTQIRKYLMSPCFLSPIVKIATNRLQLRCQRRQLWNFKLSPSFWESPVTTIGCNVMQPRNPCHPAGIPRPHSWMKLRRPAAPVVGFRVAVGLQVIGAWLRVLNTLLSF